MRRALLLCAGILSVTWLGFEVFPGHTYLQADTQLYLPMLERLNAPGYLSRDLVATHPDLTYTIYDEVTLFLHAAGLSFTTALITQQFISRGAGVLGAFLLARAVGFDDLFAFLVATLLNLGAALTGPGVSLLGYEPVPSAFATGLVLLAMGLLAREKPLLAGLAGGLALSYDPWTAAPFWIVVLAALLFDRGLRSLFRPASTILSIFILLLANLAQLQPGVIEAQEFFSKISTGMSNIQHYQASDAWVSLWVGRDIWQYLVIWTCGMWATARIWPLLNRQMRWFFVVLPLLGIISIPVSYLLLEQLRWSLVPQVRPARALLFTVVTASLACSLAGLQAALRHKNWEALLWFVISFAMSVNVRVLDLLRIGSLASLAQLVFCVALAGLLAGILTRFGSTKLNPLVLLIPFIAIFVAPRIRGVENHSKVDRAPIAEIAEWAENNTWGSSMFLFPDAGRDLYPGIFRAESRRAVWVDWKTGSLANYFGSFARDWWERWQQTMEGSFSPPRLQSMLSLPVDYYVLKRTNQLADVKPVFENREFVVYDSEDLRKSATPLRLADFNYSN
ncbi:MAG: hypothetical protein ACR2IV_18870 [Bryobacteraceae bacterium]